VIGRVVLDVAAAVPVVAAAAVLLVLVLGRAVCAVRVAVLAARFDVGDAVFIALLDVHFAHVGRACAHFLRHRSSFDAVGRAEVTAGWRRGVGGGSGRGGCGRSGGSCCGGLGLAAELLPHCSSSVPCILGVGVPPKLLLFVVATFRPVAVRADVGARSPTGRTRRIAPIHCDKKPEVKRCCTTISSGLDGRASISIALSSCDLSVNRGGLVAALADVVGRLVLDVAAAVLVVAEAPVLLVLVLCRAVHAVRVAVLAARFDVGDAVFLALLDVHFAHAAAAVPQFSMGWLKGDAP
jgi:hypothetical protein